MKEKILKKLMDNGMTYEEALKYYPIVLINQKYGLILK